MTALDSIEYLDSRHGIGIHPSENTRVQQVRYEEFNRFVYVTFGARIREDCAGPFTRQIEPSNTLYTIY